MKRSEEIEQLVRGFVEALERGDIAYIERATSREPGVVAIGSDASEYSRDFKQIIDLMRESTPQAGMQIHARVAELHGYEHGDVGWADGTGAFERDGESVEVRLTAVFVRERGEWRMVQNHASIGVPNDHMFEALFRRAPAATR
jgi:ketosteroid isomerase-like protein